jgi:hypothetical protein
LSSYPLAIVAARTGPGPITPVRDIPTIESKNIPKFAVISLIITGKQGSPEKASL